ncbi:hypothetical protein FQR65_LT01175 [Abscondita terminalis]|nr:hypothetical protein FQR65_LT01175 [Abscondita terminalis]
MSSVLLALVLLLTVSFAHTLTNYENSEYKIIQKIVDTCSFNTDKYSCLADKAAVIIEHLMTIDVTVYGGVTLAANKELRTRTPKQLDSGYDSAYPTPCEGRLYDEKKKGGKKSGKNLAYVMWVLFGIFGITGPLFMNKIALMAATGLIASKTALLIAGSVAVKKLFERDHRHAKFKLISHHSKDDDIDSNFKGAYKYFNSV